MSTDEQSKLNEELLNRLTVENPDFHFVLAMLPAKEPGVITLSAKLNRESTERVLRKCWKRLRGPG